jgi:hypothetical protein
MNSLPKDIIELIALHLEHYDLFTLVLTNKRFNSILLNPRFEFKYLKDCKLKYFKGLNYLTYLSNIIQLECDEELKIKITELIRSKIDKNSTQKCLYQAIENNKFKWVNLCLQLYPEIIDEKYKLNVTPLIYAIWTLSDPFNKNIQNDTLKLIETILKHKPDLNLIYADSTSLGTALNCEFYYVANLLIQYGASHSFFDFLLIFCNIHRSKIYLFLFLFLVIVSSLCYFLNIKN